MSARENYNEIKAKFDAFVQAWESTEVEAIDAVVTEGAESYFSIFGSENCLSREELKKNLAIRTHKTTYAKLDIINYVCLTEGDHAQQTAYINGIFADDSGEEYLHYCWSGQMANHWVKTEDGWKMDEIRFDQNLDDEKYLSRGDDLAFIVLEGNGSREFVSNWKGITDRVGWFEGCPRPAIVAEFDAPWIKIQKRDEFLTDAEQIEEVFYKYCFAIDTDCFVLFRDIFSRDLKANIFGAWGEMDYRQICATLKINRSGSRRCQHMGTFGRLKIDGDVAYSEFYCKAPATFCSFELNKDTQEASSEWMAYRWICKYVKEGGKWMISRFFVVGPETTDSELRSQEWEIPDELKA